MRGERGRRGSSHTFGQTKGFLEPNERKGDGRVGRESFISITRGEEGRTRGRKKTQREQNV